MKKEFLNCCIVAFQKPNENSKPLGAASQLIRNANLHHRLVHAQNVEVSYYSYWNFIQVLIVIFFKFLGKPCARKRCSNEIFYQCNIGKN